MIKQENKYKNIDVLVIENNVDARKLITLNLRHFGCNVFQRDFSYKFCIEELQSYQMVIISVLPDRAWIGLLMKIQKKILECSEKRKAKLVAYNAFGKTMSEECMNCGFDEVLETPAMMKDYQILLKKFFGEER